MFHWVTQSQADGGYYGNTSRPMRCNTEKDGEGREEGLLGGNTPLPSYCASPDMLSFQTIFTQKLLNVTNNYKVAAHLIKHYILK